ncbi:MAG: FHA domain-containing protein [Myxococcota bacterium]
MSTPNRPVAVQQAHVVIDGPGHDARPVALREGINAIGRLPANDIILTDALVSRHHARISFLEGRATVQDLGSHNGSFLNERRVYTASLRDEDVIRIGSFQLKFRFGPPPSQPPKRGQSLSTRNSAKAQTEPSAPPGVASLLLRLVDLAHANASDQPLVRSLAGIEHAFHTHAAAIVRREADGSIVVAAQRHRQGGEKDIDLRIPEWVVQRRFPIAVTHPSKDPRFVGCKALHPVACVPIGNHETRGALYVERAGPSFSIMDLDALQGSAHLIGAMLDRGDRDRSPWALPTPVDGSGTHPRLRQPGVAVTLEMAPAIGSSEDVLIDDHGLGEWAALVRGWVRLVGLRNGYVLGMEKGRLVVAFLDDGIDDGGRSAAEWLAGVAEGLRPTQAERLRAGACWAELHVEVWNDGPVRRLIGAGAALEGAQALCHRGAPGTATLSPEVARSFDFSGGKGPRAEYAMNWEDVGRMLATL